MRSTLIAATALATLATGCLFADEDVGDGADAAVTPDAPAAHADAHPADAGPADAGGDMLPCSADLACPTPAMGKTQICGRILDLASSQPIAEGVGSSLEVRFHDAAQLAGGAGEALLTVRPDACGRFTAGTGVAPPALGYISIVVDDLGLPAGEGAHVFTARAIPVTSNGTSDGVHAYSTLETTDAAWSSGASPSLAAQGAFVGIYIDRARPAVGPYRGLPTAGVQVQIEEMVDAANDLYFDDAAPLVRSTVGTASATGPNGTGIRTGTSLITSYTGTGPTGCTWPELPAYTFPGTIFVAEIEGSCR